MRTLLILLLTAGFGVISAETCTGDNLFPRPALPFAPEQYLCYRTADLITVDGRLTESGWQQAEPTAPFVDIEGKLRPDPRFETRAWMLWDDDYLYFAAEMEEPDVWGKLDYRDAIIFYDNDFEVFIDPDGDTHHYYELELNALNTVWDLFLVQPYRDGGPALHSWDIQGLQTGVAVQGTLNQPGDVDQGWTVEIAIPWEVLRECAHRDTPPRDGDRWRVNFSRVEWQTEVVDGVYHKVTDPATGKPLPEDNWVWSPQGLINMHYPEMWGIVQFSGLTAGAGTAVLKPREEELVARSLRQLYYEQRNRQEQQGGFVDWEQLSTVEFELPPAGWRWPPDIECTANQFIATVSHQSGDVCMTIDHEGRVLVHD